MIKREQITISLPPQMFREVKKRVKESGMTQSEFFRSAVRHFLVEDEWRPIFQATERNAARRGISASDGYDIVSEVRHKEK